MSQRVLVTGASGFVGQHLVERLAEEGYTVVAVDIHRNPPELFHDYEDQIEYIQGSVIHEDFVKNELFPTPEPYDKVFHLAAVVGVDQYVGENSHPLYTLDVNINGTKYLLEQVRGTSTHFLYTSTSEVYGRNPDVPWAEEDDSVLGPPTSPRWGYSVSKSLCEHMIHAMGRKPNNPPMTVVRPFNLYGPRQNSGFVVSKFIKMATDGEVPTVYGDGSQTRCFTFISDFIKALFNASERSPADSAVFNVGGTSEVTIAELAETVIETVGMEEDRPRFVDQETVAGEDFEDIDRRIPDISRAKDVLGWEPTVNLRDGIQKTVDWHQQ